MAASSATDSRSPRPSRRAAIGPGGTVQAVAAVVVVAGVGGEHGGNGVRAAPHPAPRRRPLRLCLRRDRRWVGDECGGGGVADEGVEGGVAGFRHGGPVPAGAFQPGPRICLAPSAPHSRRGPSRRGRGGGERWQGIPAATQTSVPTSPLTSPAPRAPSVPVPSWWCPPGAERVGVGRARTCTTMSSPPVPPGDARCAASSGRVGRSASPRRTGGGAFVAVRSAAAASRAVIGSPGTCSASGSPLRRASRNTPPVTHSASASATSPCASRCGSRGSGLGEVAVRVWCGWWRRARRRRWRVRPGRAGPVRAPRSGSWRRGRSGGIRSTGAAARTAGGASVVAAARRGCPTTPPPRPGPAGVGRGW